MAFLFDLALACALAALVQIWFDLKAAGISEMLSLACGYALYLLVSAALSPGQTPGKRVLALALIELRGQAPSRAVAVARVAIRVGVPLLLGIVLGTLTGRFQAYLGVCFVGGLFVDAYCVSYRPGRRLLADSLLGTMVVVLPPVQPHRAPAGPMYSAHDREFGPPPTKR